MKRGLQLQEGIQINSKHIFREYISKSSLGKKYYKYLKNDYSGSNILVRGGDGFIRSIYEEARKYYSSKKYYSMFTQMEFKDKEFTQLTIYLCDLLFPLEDPRKSPFKLDKINYTMYDKSLEIQKKYFKEIEMLKKILPLGLIREKDNQIWFHSGIPDLLVWSNKGEYFFSEVKSERDKLGPNQKKWFIWNDYNYKFKVEILKIKNLKLSHKTYKPKLLTLLL